jgi:membrane protease YdiL (CAAX protease family)
MSQEQTAGNAERPMWRRIVDFPLVAMLLALLVAAAGITLGVVLTQYVIPPIRGIPRSMVFDVLTAIILVALYKLVIRHLGDLKRDDLRLSGSARPLALGVVGGLIIFSAVVSVAAALGVYRITGEGDARDLIPALIASAIFPAIFEEMIFRGILFRWLEEFGGSWAALLLTSAFFGAAHLANPHASPVAAIGIAFEAGLMLGGAYMLTRSLWLAMGLHAAWNFAQGEIYGVPVSGTPVHGLVTARLSGPPLLTGNGFGLEASVIAIVIATLFGIWLVWRAAKQGEVMKPWWVRRRRVAEQA